MLRREEISRMQQKHVYTAYQSEAEEDKAQSSKHHTIKFTEVLEFCQKYISANATNAFRRETDPVKKRQMTFTQIG